MGIDALFLINTFVVTALALEVEAVRLVHYFQITNFTLMLPLSLNTYLPLRINKGIFREIY